MVLLLMAIACSKQNQPAPPGGEATGQKFALSLDLTDQPLL